MKMSEFHAAMGLCNLKYVDIHRQERKEMIELYRKLLRPVEGIELMYEGDSKFEIFSYFYVIFRDGIRLRDEVFDYLKENGFLARKYFYPVLTEMKSIQEKFLNSDVSVAKQIADSILCLPLYIGLDQQDIYRICFLIQELLEG